MINHGGWGRLAAESGHCKALTRSPGLAMVVPMNGHLAICSICREIMS